MQEPQLERVKERPGHYRFAKRKEGQMTDQLPIWKFDEDGDYSSVKTAHIGPLPAGLYRAFINTEDQLYFTPKKPNSDTLIDLPGLPIGYVLEQIESFWSKAEEYKKFGFLQKRGIMFYGPPGGGKSSIVGLLLRQLTRLDGVCFVADNFSVLSESIARFRKVEVNRPIMTLVEDIETNFESSNGSNFAQNERAALALYDGEQQVNNIVHVATTNKPELIADRFIRRPGRFDLVIGIHAPTREAREAYLKTICNEHLTAKQLSDIVNQTEGLSLAYLREIASTYLVLGLPLDETIKRLQDQSKKKFSNKTGFTVGYTAPKQEY